MKLDFTNTLTFTYIVDFIGNFLVRYYVQHHVASTDHYDLRLEIEPGVFKSWALPKGVPTKSGEARLAIPTADHYDGYLLEGIISEGYGKGVVQLYDSGEWIPKDPITESKINFYVDSDRIQGGYYSLIRTGANWLIMHHQGVFTDIQPDVSVLTGRTLSEISQLAPFKPAKAKLVEEIPISEEYLYSQKLDGYRVLIQKGPPEVFKTTEYPNIVRATTTDETHLFSKNGELWDTKYPEIYKEIQQLTHTIQLDGEIVVESDSPFADLHAGKGTPVLYIFDAPSIEGTLEERLEWLRTNIPETEHVRILEHKPTAWGPCTLNQEGLIIKDKNKPYPFGRREWLKYKCKQEQEFLILGYTKPTGKRQCIGSLLLGYYQDGVLKYAGKVGTGLSAENLDEIYNKIKDLPAIVPLSPTKAEWKQPTLVAQVKFSEWTQDGKLRHPSFVSLRDDVELTDVIQELPTLTNPDKLIFPEVGVTKAKLAAYYEAVADRMLPELKNRPIIVYRCPDGVDKQCFWQRNATQNLPGLEIVDVAGRKHYVVQDKRGLQSLAQLAVVEIHSYNFTTRNPESPDRMILDIDPGEDTTWEDITIAAMRIKEKLDARGLTSFVKSTGGEGIHVVVPLKPVHSFDEVRSLAKAIAEEVATANDYTLLPHPKKLTIDWLRNDRYVSTIATWSPRATSEGTVSVPLDWNGLLHAKVYTIASAVMHEVQHNMQNVFNNLIAGGRPM